MGKKSKILIIDDDSMVRHYLRDCLTDAGYNLIEAEDGFRGYDLAVRERPDLILLDIKMPGRDGYETCRAIKEVDSIRDTPIIFSTSVCESNCIVECFRAGAADYLMKPFELVELLARIETHIKLRTQQEEVNQKNKIIARELEMASLFQQSLLPGQFPASSKVKCMARLIPALHVAGDFYDFIDLGGGFVGIIIADVSGHGVCAAMVAAMLKIDFLAFSTINRMPADVLSMVNMHLCEILKFESFSTAFYGILNTKKQILSYSMAGHPPPLFYQSKSNGVSAFSPGGLPLGVLQDTGYENREVPVRKLDKLLLYTDGVTEVINEKNEIFSEMRLRESFIKNIRKPVKEIDRAIYDEVTAFTGGTPMEDDLTMIIIGF